MTEEQVEELAITENELQELKRAGNIPLTFDEDRPKTTPEKEVKFRQVNPPRQQQKNLG